jgi:hypothetical protein
MSGFVIQAASDVSWMWLYDDSGSGATADGSAWRAKAPAGYLSVGDCMVLGHAKPTTIRAVFVRDGDSYSRQPTDYVAVWSDSGSGGSNDCVIWRPVAPAGYTALGCLVTSGAKPALGDMRCVKSSLVSAGSALVPSWTDAGSGAHQNLATYCNSAYHTFYATNGGPPTSAAEQAWELTPAALRSNAASSDDGSSSVVAIALAAIASTCLLLLVVYLVIQARARR